jgi:hypothetical protein
LPSLSNRLITLLRVVSSQPRSSRAQPDSVWPRSLTILLSVHASSRTPNQLDNHHITHHPCWYFTSWCVEALNQPKTKSWSFPLESWFLPLQASNCPENDCLLPCILFLPSGGLFHPSLFTDLFLSASPRQEKARASRHGASQTPGPGTKRGNSISGIINAGHLYSALVCSR